MFQTKTDENRCVLTLALLTEPWQESILDTRFRIMEHLQNSLIATELRKLKNLQRTRAYRDLQQQIAASPPESRKPLYQKRRKLLREAGFTEYAFKNDMTPMQKHFCAHIAAQVAHRTASDVWRAFETYLFHGGHSVHFKRKGSLNSVANQTVGNGMSYRNDTFCWNGGNCKDQIKLSIKVAYPKTVYEQEMLKKQHKNYRVIRKWVKTRYKYYLQINLVGTPIQKPRRIGHGRVGLDIGTQSIAIAAPTAVHLLELADRVVDNHQKIMLLQRKMDASRRCMNPDNFNSDGTIRRGVKLQWNVSRHYVRYRGQLRQLQRKNADLRKYQHICLANYILTLGSEIYVEDMNYRALQHRAKETTVNAAGRFNRKKRFGKSLANKAPAMFLTILDQKLASRQLPPLQKVNTWSFRASQYDHLSQQYHKKRLSQRTHHLSNGDVLQRDLYSAFLLMNAAADLQQPDPQRCQETYPQFKQLHDLEIQRLQNDSRQHLSSFGVA